MTPWTAAPLSPGVCSNSCPLSQWCHPTISCSVTPFTSCPQLFWHQGLFQWVGSLYKVAKVLELQLQHQSFQWIFRVDFLYDWLAWYPCYSLPRTVQEEQIQTSTQIFKTLVLIVPCGFPVIIGTKCDDWLPT